MTDDVRRLGRIRGLALLVGALSLVVVAVSAYLRLEAAGIGCADWPACYGSILAGHPPALQYGFARLLHRIAASVALVLACVMLWQCLRPQPLAAARPALLLLALMLALSVLGFFSADPRRALVGFLNIVGGLGLVSFSWRVALAARPGGGKLPEISRSRLFRAGAVVLTLTVLLGAWLGATYSARACLTVPFCEGGVEALVAGWGGLNPLLSLQSAPLPGAADGVLLHLLHRGMAVLTLLLLGGALVSGLEKPEHRSLAATTFGLLVGVAVLGVASVASGYGLWFIIAHGALAALLLAALATLLRTR